MKNVLSKISIGTLLMSSCLSFASTPPGFPGNYSFPYLPIPPVCLQKSLDADPFAIFTSNSARPPTEYRGTFRLNGLPPGVHVTGLARMIMIRESPTLRESPSRISSFFDVFLELSIRGLPSPGHTTLTVLKGVKINGLLDTPPTSPPSNMAPYSLRAVKLDQNSPTTDLDISGLIGDPDFDLLSLNAKDKQLTGHVTLIKRTDNGSKGFAVDSFFDITYAVEYTLRESPSKASLGKLSVHLEPVCNYDGTVGTNSQQPTSNVFAKRKPVYIR